ncbi:hypothetical protein JOA57_12720 [Xanthomonas campestris pv. campestris]|nr:hypothetical protein JOA57_12720 [Xanthomonas campestris pv. campestris]
MALIGLLVSVRENGGEPLQVFWAVDLPLFGHRPIRLAGAIERQFLEVFGARQSSNKQVSVRLAQLGHALILQLCEEPNIARPKDHRTHMRLRQVLRLQGAFDKPAAHHGLQIDGHTLDERPATGGRPAQMMRDAHASVSSACFLPSNPTKSDFYVKNQCLGSDWRREWDSNPRKV